MIQIAEMAGCFAIGLKFGASWTGALLCIGWIILGELMHFGERR